MYTGDYLNDDRHGKGTYNSTDGEEYVGDWQFDMMDGEGKYTWISGDVYTGVVLS